MKTIKHNNKRHNVTYRTNSEMATKGSYMGKTHKALGCDVYNVKGESDIVALALTSNGNSIRGSAIVISSEEYEAILDLRDPYHVGRYHTALLNACGAENHLELL